jgi:hypothetical protein
MFLRICTCLAILFLAACRQTTEPPAPAPTQRLTRAEAAAIRKRIEDQAKNFTPEQKEQLDSLVRFLNTHKGQADE